MLRLKRFDEPTSVENLAYRLFTEISAMGFHLETLEVQETDTSTVAYTPEDWMADNRRLQDGKRDAFECRHQARRSHCDVPEPAYCDAT